MSRVRGDACNRGQFMGNKPSSRVLAQPGGNSTFSLGWGEPAPKPAQPQKTAVPVEEKENFVPTVNASMTNAAPPQAAQPEQQGYAGAGRQTASANVWASNASQNSGNMLSERPTTRIHAPPGGKSSITF